jgi:electron transfer flavoprotein alpha subunit
LRLRPQRLFAPRILSFAVQALQLKPAMFSAARTSALRHARTQLRLAQPVTVTLAVLEQRDGKLNPASLSAITAGTKLGGSITAFVAGSGVKSVADEAAKVKGVEKVIYVENGAYEKVRERHSSHMRRC